MGLATSLMFIFLPSLMGKNLGFYICTLEESIFQYPCPGYEWSNILQFCVSVSKSKATWMEARQSCLRIQADLITIDSEEMAIAVTGQMAEGVNAYWIGLNRLNNDWEYRWPGYKEVDYTAWNNGSDAAETNVTKFCVVAAGSDRREMFQWWPEDCEAKHVFVCMRRGGHNPDPPSVVVTSHEKGDVMWSGQALSASCSGFVSSNGNLQIYFLFLGQTVKESLEVYEEKEYALDRGRCGIKSVAKVEMAVDQLHDGGVLVCCRVVPGNESICTESHPLRVLYRAAVPKLHPNKQMLDSTQGRLLSVRCVGFVGTRGKLVWYVDLQDRSEPFVGTVPMVDPQNFYVDTSEVGHTITRKPVVHYGTDGPEVTSEIFLVVNQTVNDDAFISCGTSVGNDTHRLNRIIQELSEISETVSPFALEGQKKDMFPGQRSGKIFAAAVAVVGCVCLSIIMFSAAVGVPAPVEEGAPQTQYGEDLYGGTCPLHAEEWALQDPSPEVKEPAPFTQLSYDDKSKSTSLKSI